MTQTSAAPVPPTLEPDGSPPPTGVLPPSPLMVLRGAWRRLRRMSTALGLLFALAWAAVVGTLVPQEPAAAQAAADWRSGAAGPGRSVATILDRLSLFDVFGSWWFLTLVALLFISLTGCLIPRWRALSRMLRRPPVAGHHLERLGHSIRLPADVSPSRALEEAATLMRRRHFRVRLIPAAQSPDGVAQLAAERGRIRELGNLVFHSAFYLLLVGAVIGQAWGFVGQVNLVEGESVADTRLSYDATRPGRWFSPGDHRGFVIGLRDVRAGYHANGLPASYVSRLALTGADGTRRQADTRVNEPVSFRGAKLYQMRYGFAPRVIVRGPDGSVLFDRAIPLTDIGGNRWAGTEKVLLGGVFTDPSTGASRPAPQMALDLVVLPDARLDAAGAGLRSAGAEPANPLLVADVYAGPALGLERGVSASALRPGWGARDRLASGLLMRPGQPIEVAGGLLRMEFAGLPEWSGLQVNYAPGRPLLLAAAVLALAGLIPSLYAYRRRLWVVARTETDGARTGTVVRLAGVAQQRGPAFTQEYTAISQQLRRGLRSAKDP